MMVMQWTQNDLRIHAESTSFPSSVSHLEPQLSQLQVSPRLGINLAKREPIVGRRLSNSEVEILCSACCHLLPFVAMVRAPRGLLWTPGQVLARARRVIISAKVRHWEVAEWSSHLGHGRYPPTHTHIMCIYIYIYLYTLYIYICVCVCVKGCERSFINGIKFLRNVGP